MKHILVHEKIIDGKFAGGKKIVTFDSIEKALKYYEQTIKSPLAQRIKQRRIESLQAFNKMSREIELRDSIKSNDPDKILSPEKTAEFNKLFSNPNDQNILCINWPNIWKVYLYENINYKGKRYTLDLTWKDFKYDTSLVDNNFNDRGSSIDVGKLVLVVICAEHTWFGGDWWWFFNDDKDFRNNGCNDRISSIAATCISVTTLVNMLLSLMA